MIVKMDTRLRVLLGTLFMILVLLLAALAGCDLAPSPRSTIPTRSPAATVPPTTPVPAVPSPTPMPTPIGPVPSVITLTIWGPEQLAPGQADPGGQILQMQYLAFMSAHPDLGLEYVLKAPYGEGGLLHSLLAASYAAPDILPDVVLIDAFELGTLPQAGLAQPLQELISEELRGDLFPFAEEACTFDGNLVALQFEADIEHLVYYSRTLEAPPVTWADLFTESIRYIFPAAGEGRVVNDAFLIQYMAQGGQLVDEQGRPTLEPSAMQRVLRFYDEGINRDVISSRVLDLHSLEECWQAYTEGNITVSNISSWRYLTSRTVLRDTMFASLPTETGATATMSRGWAFAIVTTDPQRQAAAARFIEWLVAPQNLAQWCYATDHLPTRSSALRLTGWPDDYTDFLTIQLQNAFFRPSISDFDKIAQALQGAVEDVLTGERTPRQATLEVQDSME